MHALVFGGYSRLVAIHVSKICICKKCLCIKYRTIAAYNCIRHATASTYSDAAFHYPLNTCLRKYFCIMGNLYCIVHHHLRTARIHCIVFEINLRFYSICNKSFRAIATIFGNYNDFIFEEKS